MTAGIGITGVGSYLPMQALANHDIAARLGKPAEWIEEKTGIRKRHIAHQHDTVTSMAAEAARRALRDAGVDSDQIALIVTASSTPGRLIPSIACGVQGAIGANRAVAFDVNAACAGFIYAVHVALAVHRSGQCDGPILVIGSERYSRHLDYDDRRTAPLFGDGAGAVVLDRVPEPYGLLYTRIGSDGRKENYVRIAPDGNRSMDPYTLTMDGPATRAFIEEQIPKLFDEVLEDVGIALEDLDVIIPHQANMRLIGDLLAKAGVQKEQTWATGHIYGNTGAASVPITIDSARLAGKLTDGATVLLAALGSGMTWGTAVLRWYPIPARSSAL